MNVDPSLPGSLLDQYVRRAFGENVATAEDTLDRATIIRRLQTGSIRRYEKKEKE